MGALEKCKTMWYLFHTSMASFAVAGVFTYACTVFLSLHAWTSWFPAFLTQLILYSVFTCSTRLPTPRNIVHTNFSFQCNFLWTPVQWNDPYEVPVRHGYYDNVMNNGLNPMLSLSFVDHGRAAFSSSNRPYRTWR